MGHLSPRALGGLIGLIGLALDQASKLWLIFGFGLEARGPVRLTPFFDLVMAWNPGISYSLFSASSDAGRYALLGVQLAAIAFLSVWLWRARTRMTAIGLGMIVGSALGNAYDRFAYGAVADFAHFHIGDFSWYIFNIADVGIVVGVALLLYESFFVREEPDAAQA
jgi:signal peptidase II